MTSAYPRLLILDHTRIGSLSATGQVKSRLFRGWPPGRIRQISSATGEFGWCAGDGQREKRFPLSVAVEAARAFRPELIYIRPTEEPSRFWELIESVASYLNSVPVAVHIMDDWMTRAEDAGEGGAVVTKKLTDLIRGADCAFSISHEMSIALWQRYGIRSKPYANVVEPYEVLAATRRQPEANGVVRVRYSGALAQDMTYGSVIKVADVIESLSTASPVLLELSILPHWLRDAGAKFRDSERVSVVAAENSEADYRRWLSGADINLLAYNFDERSVSYLRYSMANKLPDYLSAGRPILAFGPEFLPTIRAARESGAAMVVDRDDQHLLAKALTAIIADPSRRQAMGHKAHEAAFVRLNGPATRTQFHRDLIGLTGREARAVSYMSGHKLNQGMGKSRPPLIAARTS